MKAKITLPLLAMLAAGSMLCLSGCNADVTTINEEEVPVEEAVEEENLAEGTVLFHSVWYDAEGNKLPDVNVAFYEDETLSFSGTTDENGDMEAFTLPCNTTLFCSVTDEAGNPIAESDVVIKLSDNYESIAIYPTRDVESEEETPTLTIEIPTGNVNLRAGFYVTQSGTVSLANLTPYVEPETEEAVAEETEEAAEEQTEEATEEAAEEQTEEAAEEQNNEEQNNEEQNNEEQNNEEQNNEEQNNEEQNNEEQNNEEQNNEEQNNEEQNNEEQNNEE